MKCLARYCYVFFLLISTTSRAADENVAYCNLEENADKQQLLVEDAWLQQTSYKNLKAAFEEAEETNNVPVLIALYFLSKQKQQVNTGNAALLGCCSAYCVSVAPFTLGFTLIAGVPLGIFCAVSSVKAHKIRKLKRKAKVALDLIVPSDIFLKITKAQNFADVREIKKALEQKGIVTEEQHGVLFNVLVSKLLAH